MSKRYTVILLLALLMVLPSCKESERHKAKRLGLEHGRESRVEIPPKTENFSFSEDAFGLNDSVEADSGDEMPLIIASELPSGPLAMEG